MKFLRRSRSEKTDLRVRYKDLGDLILACEFHHSPSDIPAAKDACFDVQTPCETEMLFYGLSLLGR